MDTPEADPFRAVHRAERRRTLGRGAAGALLTAAILAAAWVVPAVAQPDPPVASEAVRAPGAAPTSDAASNGLAGPASVPTDPASAPPDPVSPPDLAVGADATAGAAAGTSEPAATQPAAPPAPTAAAAPSAPTTPTEIGIHTSGYQMELDRCLWVRMDLGGATAPIVGAHNNCGGEVVLALSPGDIVELSGERLDGRFVVTGDRDGYPGQSAAEATAGTQASVILQTCYFDSDEVRLVALTRVG